jgi:hypothetical protein
MTLPERVLEQLTEIDPDRACAVVKAIEAVLGTAKGAAKPVELIEMAPGKALIVTGPSKALRVIPWLKTIEIAPARFLLTIPSGTPIEALEVALRDVANMPTEGKSEQEIAVLNELLNLIGQNRRALRLSKVEVLIINIA